MTAEPGAGDQRMPDVQRGHPGAHELNAGKRPGRLGGVGHTLTLNGPARSGHRVNYRRFHRFLDPEGRAPLRHRGNYRGAWRHWRARNCFRRRRLGEFKLDEPHRFRHAACRSRNLPAMRRRLLAPRPSALHGLTVADSSCLYGESRHRLYRQAITMWTVSHVAHPLADPQPGRASDGTPVGSLEVREMS